MRLLTFFRIFVCVLLWCTMPPLQKPVQRYATIITDTEATARDSRVEERISDSLNGMQDDYDDDAFAPSVLDLLNHGPSRESTSCFKTTSTNSFFGKLFKQPYKTRNDYAVAFKTGCTWLSLLYTSNMPYTLCKSYNKSKVHLHCVLDLQLKFLFW